MRALQWLVAQTQPNSENKAAYNLEKQGYQIYLPRYLKRRRHARKTDYVSTPLFPRYIFIGLDLKSQRWRSIQSTYGIARLVTNGQEPALLPGSIIEAIMQRQDEKGFVKLERNIPFKMGEKIRVVAGVFADSNGLFESVADGDRVAILLDLLGQKIRVTLGVDMVAAA